MNPELYWKLYKESNKSFVNQLFFIHTAEKSMCVVCKNQDYINQTNHQIRFKKTSFDNCEKNLQSAIDKKFYQQWLQPETKYEISEFIECSSCGDNINKSKKDGTYEKMRTQRLKEDILLDVPNYLFITIDRIESKQDLSGRFIQEKNLDFRVYRMF